MSVKTIFIILGTVVACIIAIAFAINVILPNVIAGTSTAVENSLYQATGMSMDFNGDGGQGQNTNNVYNANVDSDDDKALTGEVVDGFGG